jgi:hypothetical protein
MSVIDLPKEAADGRDAREATGEVPRQSEVLRDLALAVISSLGAAFAVQLLAAAFGVT